MIFNVLYGLTDTLCLIPEPGFPSRTRTSGRSISANIHAHSWRLGVDLTALQDKISRTDAEINARVYKLYGLTLEEIGTVEEK